LFSRSSLEDRVLLGEGERGALESMNLASSSVSVSLALCPAYEPAAARRASSESHHTSASLERGDAFSH